MPAKCKDRERMLQAGNEDVPALPLGAVRGALCFRCFDPSDKILKCGACRRAGYCSKACQKVDWTLVHKKQCKVLQTINERDLQDYKDRRTWNEYRLTLLQYVRSLRETTSVPDVVFIIQAQPYCSSCYRSANQLMNHALTLQACPNCKLAHHCSECSDKHSKAACVAYQEQNEMEQFRIEFFEDTGRASVVECTQKPRVKQSTLKDCTSWYDYFTKISDKQDVKNFITPDFSSISEAAKQGGAERKSFEERRRKFLVMATDNLTMPLTILSALEDLELSKESSIDVHLLGATGREFLGLTIFEELLHLLPNLQHLAITAIGPSTILFGQEAGIYSPKEELPCCPSCQSKARRRTIASYKGLYHDFAKSSWYKTPTLIVAFNSGFVDGDDADTDWVETIQLIVRSGVPALFTTYNEREARNERIRMESLGAKFVVEPALNPWRGLVASPELLDDEYTFWHQNDHRYVIQGARK